MYYQTLPFLFTALAIITLMKYKLRVYFLLLNEKVPTQIRVSINCFILLTIAGFIILPTASISK